MKRQRLMSPQYKANRLDLRIQQIGNVRSITQHQNLEVNTCTTSPKNSFNHSNTKKRPKTAIKQDKVKIREIIKNLKSKNTSK